MSSVVTRFSGFPVTAIAAAVLEQWQAHPRPTLIVSAENATAERLYRDLRFFALAPDKAYLTHLEEEGEETPNLPQLGMFPAWDVLPFDSLSPSVGISSARLHGLHLLLHSPAIVVTTIQSLQHRILAQESLRSLTMSLRAGEEIDRAELLRTLAAGGYLRTSTVEEYGQMAVRGSVIDIFPPGTGSPLRVEFFDETIESLRFFKPDSQLSIKAVDAFDVLPVREILVGAELQRLSGTQSISLALQNLRQRAAEISVPGSKLARVEAAVQEGFYWPGIEHLQPIITPLTSTILSYLAEDASVCVVEEKTIALEADSFEELTEERAERAEREARLFPPVSDAYLRADEALSQLQERITSSYNAVGLIGTEELQADAMEKQQLAQQSRMQAVAAQAARRQREIGFSSGPPELPEGAKRFTGNSRLRQQLQIAKHGEQPLKPLAEYLAKLQEQRITRVLVAASESRQARLQQLLEGYGILSTQAYRTWSELPEYRAEQPVLILRGALSGGFVDQQRLRAVIPEREIFPERKEIQSQKRRAETAVKRLLGTLSDLKEGQYVVHMDYGIARYMGLRQKKVEGSVGDFLELVYAEEAKLFLPVDALGKIQKYTGADGSEPKLTRLGGKVWEKTKKKIQEQVAELAGRLISTMAERELSEGISFGPLSAEDRDFADAFPYTETPDQARAIEEVLGDMAQSKPMDRLVCGDVGYGKTEVAMRAAYKAAQNGMQIAIVVPTTVLARQHYTSFLERFEATPVTVGSLSRFNSTEENKRVIAGLAAGTIDIVIGTHRVLQRDIAFANLGLVIIDEEHRFGVVHKERLKRFRSTVDVLTLSATPIPRTLHMSLVGIRDLSVIETAPVNRQVIRTYLAEYDDAVVREAILRELGRSGQVFYIHNRVQTIGAMAAELQELVPEARIGIGHGQMKERELERVMYSFINKEIDVLVSTTIVESGLDIPNANTIIIRSAENFGLAELYQLRGRVGRSSRRAYAYLLINNPTSLTRDARKRLEVLQSIDDLGVGFRLALQDMEIRGAGNLLGKDQSGNINLIGYELYSRILRDAVEQLQNNQRVDSLPRIDPEIKIGFPTHIPPWYLPDVGQRLLLYQRLVEADEESAIAEMLEEIVDRFGPPPAEVHCLFEYMALRCFARRYMIEVLRRSNDTLLIRFHEKQTVDAERALALQAANRGVKLSPGRSIQVRVDWEAVEDPGSILSQLAPLMRELFHR